MAKNESTAVNALLALPLRNDAEVDLFAGLPSLAQARAVKPAQRAEIPALPRARSAQGTTPQPIAQLKAALPKPVAQAKAALPKPVAAAPVAQPKVAEIYNATVRVPLAGRGLHWLWFAVPAVFVGSLGASLVMRMRESAPAPSAPVAMVVTTPAPHVAAPAPAVAPIAPIVTTPPVIDVRFDSEPAGATVTLIDHGRPRFLGVTPVIAGVDSTGEAEVVFTGEGRQTQLAHFDPRTTQHVDTALPAEPVAVAPVPPHGRRVARTVARKHH